MEPSALVLLSGGIDSTVLLYYVRDVLEYTKIEAILFDYGQRHKIELEYAQYIAENYSIPYKVIEVNLAQFGGRYWKDDTVVVPARNSIFLSMATAYTEVRDLQDIFIGANAEDFKDFLDCRPDFINLMSHALATGNNIRGVYAPFVNHSKQEIINMGRLLQVPFENTWSCYDPTYESFTGVGKPCGKCHACIERNKVL